MDSETVNETFEVADWLRIKATFFQNFTAGSFQCHRLTMKRSVCYHLGLIVYLWYYKTYVAYIQGMRLSKISDM